MPAVWAEGRGGLFRQMQYFVAVADCGSFTEAAERCYISQSAVSQQIAALEADLGVKLLEREGRKVSLTPAGKYFYGRCRAILSEVEEARAETLRLASDGELRLDIGYLSGYDGRELQGAVVEFSGLYPEVLVNAFEGTHEALYRAVRSGEANFLLSDARRAFSDEYENYILAQAPARIDVSATHPLAGQAQVTAEQLERYPCILVSDPVSQESERAFYAEDLGIGRQFLFAAGLNEARLLAMSGRGYLLVDSVAPAAEPPLARLEVRRNDGSPIVRTYCAFWQKRRSNYYLEEFASILRAHFAQGR